MIFWKDRSSFRDLYRVLILLLLLLISPLKKQNYLNSIVSASSLILICLTIVVSERDITKNDIELRFQTFSDNLEPLLTAIIPLGVVYLMILIIR